MPKSNTLQSFCMYLKKYCIAEADTENFIYCFRGHKSKSFEYKPSLLRNKGYVENEEYIKDEVITHYPELFHEPGNITIEDLAIMQHYGIPTDLIDVSLNPLVALFFATEKDKGKEKYLPRYRRGLCLSRAGAAAFVPYPSLGACQFLPCGL